jgi:hypothetical protein
LKYDVNRVEIPAAAGERREIIKMK